MKQKKPKGGPARPARPRKGPSDLVPSTSLPPLVEGPLRCFLKLTVSKTLWLGSKPPASCRVRVRWWGETSDGTVFTPRGASQAQQTAALQTTTRYPVRCGPKQFTSYLTDMGVLILEVTAKSDHLPIGRVQVGGLAQLSPSHPISGFFTIVSPTAEKMGELQVLLALEPLSETYGGGGGGGGSSSSSIPNTAVSFSGSLPARGAKDTAEQMHRPPSLSLGRRESGGSSSSSSSSRVTTPRGKDHRYLQENSENVAGNLFEPRHSVIPGKAGSLNANASKQQQVQVAGGNPKPVRVLSWHNPATKDLLSALLDQGNRLRNAMVESAMKSRPDLGLELHDTHPVIKHEVARPATKNLKDMNSDLISAVEDHFQPLPDYSEFDVIVENRAIQLLLGSSDLPQGRLLDGPVSAPASLSPGSDVYDSELNDPRYDQSLLEHLFYTTQKSESSLSDLSDVERAESLENPNGPQSSQPMRESSPSGREGKVPETIPRPLSPHETSMETREQPHAINLSLDGLAMLGRIHVARVLIDSLKIPPEGGSQSTPGKTRSTGKPPRPHLAKKRTFFVEYHFPVGASKNGIGQVSITTDTIRVASSKITGDVVKFQQRYVFPLHFSGTMITLWWESNLAFNIYSKKGTQRKPLLLGSALFPLRDVIQSEQLKVSHELPVEEQSGQAQLGLLKVSVELAADNKDLPSANARAPSVAPVYSVRSPGVKLKDAGGSPVSVESPRLLKQSNGQLPNRPQEPSTPGFEKPALNAGQQLLPKSTSSHLFAQRSPLEEEGLLLHTLLMVPEGRDFVPGDSGLLGSCNVYLNCKLFSTEEATRSAVAWGTSQPTFAFSQVTPISLTSKHLERLKNNVMVIEVWNKVHSPGGDQLLGLVKLPLHQFYLSFRDPKISSLLLQAQYPVVAVDSLMPVVDIFTGSKTGRLKVILAMGSADQVVALQRLKKDEMAAPPIVLRPAHALDPLATPPSKSAREGEGLVEHVFEIQIESIKGLTPLQSTVWGEADCYVQYHFPVQEESGSSVLCGTELFESGIQLKPFRSATALCVPDPIFHNTRHRHSLLVPADVPVQRLLLSAFSARGLAGGGGISFEIWCRYYYPNVRDQLVAKGTLPLSRLCAMVTMQHREEVGIQPFSLPLIPRIEGSGEAQPRSSGLLDVNIKYRHSRKATEGILAAQIVALSVQIHAAASLQAAARAAAEANPSLWYSAEVGVNAYVSVHLPFLPEGEKRSTRAVARSFCPEFEHHSEFPCNLVVQRSSGEAHCLAELLQVSEMVFTIFHQNLDLAPGATSRTPTARDYLLGTVTVPTKDLLIRRSGIRGWYPVNIPEELVPSQGTNVMPTIVGGLELSVLFAHPGDRERVLEAAKLLGWSWEETHKEGREDNSDGDYIGGPHRAQVTVSIPRLWLPVHCVLLAGETRIKKSTRCYLRYKLYDQEATWTSLKRPNLAEDKKQVTVSFKKSKRADLPRSQALFWYFREEKLELQVWRAYGSESSTERPLDTDRLIGSAYVDLAALGESSRKARTVSGVYPLFRRNAPNLLGAAVRVHIALASTCPTILESSEDGGGGGGGGGGTSTSTSESEEGRKALKPDGPDWKLSNRQPEPPVVETPSEKPCEEMPCTADLEKTFAVSVLVERAMHLSLKGSPLTERGVTAPSSYVSFVVANADHPVATDIVENTDSPIWGFQQQARLSQELLLDPQQTLIFKVWHKADVERVIGFASVDLSPLLSGFQLVCGWYNIMDFSGQCQGQIKVAVSPLESISHLKEERQERIRTKAPGSSIPPASPFAFQMKDLYDAAFPTLSTRGTEKLFRSSMKGTDATCHLERVKSSDSWLPRHKEHVKNIRRFHESLQQTERNVHQAGGLDSVPHSSRDFLLRALRKNLSELDEIQRYFSQKLTRYLPDVEEHRSKPLLCPVSRVVDSEGGHLLEKSSHLVSQVSGLIDDLQNNIRRNEEESAEACGVHSRASDAAGALPPVLGQSDGGVRTELAKDPLRSDSSSAHVEGDLFLAFGKASCGGRSLLYEFLEQSSQGDPPSPAGCEQREGDAVQSQSEEEYDDDDEDVVEPRMLNEITTVTDQTSPWSSVDSEAGQHRVQQVADIRTAEPLVLAAGHSHSGEGVGSRFVSGDPPSTPSSARSSRSPFGEVGSEDAGKRDPEEPLQPVPASDSDWAEEPGAVLQEAPSVPGKMPAREPLTFSGSRDFATAEAAAPEEVCVEFQSEEGPHLTREEGHQSRPELAEAAEHARSFSEESCEDLPGGEVVESLKPRVVLSDPVIVPNFFLPPQHLEASMRLLSVAPSPLTAARKTQEGTTSRGIPYRRRSRHKGSLTPADRPEGEMKRIARIFSTQFSKTE